MNIKEAISKVVGFENLTERQTRDVFGEIMSGKAAPSQIGAFITALHMKEETVEEITGAAKAMRQKALKIKVRGTVLDTCGTGGTGIKRFNISTTVAFVLAGCGVKVAKHGNRAASSHCGSADVLEKLGVKIDIPAKLTEKCLKEIGIGFLFAPLFHGAMKYAAPPRREIGIRTIFNILGPLCNPASANRQVLGVFDERLTEPMAKVLKNLGIKRAFVVHGTDGLDEVTVTGKTKVTELRDGRIRSYSVSPGTFGLKKAALSGIKGKSAKENAGINKSILTGATGPRRDVVLMNSSVALVAAGKAKNFKEGVKLAAKSIDSAKALEKLEKLVEITNKGAK